jgi:hypothetical protein
VQQIQALPTRDQSGVFRGDAFHLSPVGGFPVAWIAKHHAIRVEGVKVAFLSFIL